MNALLWLWTPPRQVEESAFVALRKYLHRFLIVCEDELSQRFRRPTISKNVHQSVEPLQFERKVNIFWFFGQSNCVRFGTVRTSHKSVHYPSAPAVRLATFERCPVRFRIVGGCFLVIAIPADAFSIQHISMTI